MAEVATDVRGGVGEGRRGLYRKRWDMLIIIIIIFFLMLGNKVRLTILRLDEEEGERCACLGVKEVTGKGCPFPLHISAPS